MTKQLRRMAALVLLACLAATSWGSDLKVASYNIRWACDSEDGKHNDAWPQRRGALCSLLNWERPHVVGMQEALKSQIDDMLQLMPGYAYIGVGREDGIEGGEYSPILYRTDRLKLLEQGTFWLAEDSSRPVMGWDAACKRVCSWGYFEDLATGRRLYCFNTHMDHIGVTARREGARLIVRKMQELMRPGELAVLSGDFNVDQTSEPYTVLANCPWLKDAYQAAATRLDPGGTWNDWDVTNYTPQRIDHLFVSQAFTVDAWAMLTNFYWLAPAQLNESTGEMDVTFTKAQVHVPADHYPIMARLSY